MIIEIILFVVVILIVLQIDKKPKGLPPGPWGLPVLGDLSSGKTITNDYIEKLKKKYGDIFSIRAGSLFFIFMTDFDTIKTVFNRPEFQGRPPFYTFKLFSYFQNIGLIESEGEHWNNNRRFALRHLRDLGFGKTRMQTSIQYEAQELVSHFEKLEGKPTDIGFEVNVAVLNIIWQLVSSKRHGVDDEKMVKFTTMITNSLEVIQGPAAILNAFPWLVKILPTALQNKIFQLDWVYNHRDTIYSYIREVIDEHVEKFDPNNLEDYIDHYLMEVEREKGNPDTPFKDDYMDLMVSIGDFFVAGSETTSSTLRWMVLLLATHPEVQKKMQKLIDDVVPNSRQPALEDRNELVYVEAVLLETMRYSSFVGQGVPHTATSESKIDNYDVPKGTILIACHALCHHNQSYFEHPNEFYPEHFIGENGELLTKKQGFAPFSIGRRQCLGESLAKAELFIFATTLLQNFNINSHPDHPLDLGIDTSMPFFSFTKPYKVCLEKRISAE